jgi:uncharacterized membrane protein YqhA
MLLYIVLVMVHRGLHCNSNMKTMQLPSVAAILLLLGVADIALVSLSLLMGKIKTIERAYSYVLFLSRLRTRSKCCYHEQTASVV